MHLRVLDIQYLHECINIELKIAGKVFNIISIALYRSPSQLQDTFEKFPKKFELNMDRLVQKKPFLVILIGDFNVKSENWFKSEVLEGILESISHHSLVYNNSLRN